MQFNSISFIFSFFPLFLVAYFCVRPELRTYVMVLGSLIFYALSSGGNYWWVTVLAAVTVYTYYTSKLLARHRSKALLGVLLAILAGVLVFFKVYQGGRYLPAGMSFFLFQIAAYMIDVYRQRIFPDSRPASYAEQIVMFPKLLSGPLMNPRDLQLETRYCRPKFEHVQEGLRTLIIGLGMKVLIANRLGGLWGQASVVGYESISTAYAWLALIAWTMQLYFDFYGYSLMAKGIGKMLGYDLPDNFLDPYASRTVSEFYRRWHVTLGSWFREYVYIPLGGNRKGTFLTIVNLAIVWLFTGLWHGVGGNYLLWAGILFFFIVNERLWLGKLLKKTKVICHIYTVLAILISWIPFAIGDWDQMMIYVSRLVGQVGAGVNPRDFIIWGGSYAWILAAGALLATPLPGIVWKKIRKSWIADVLMFVLFWVVVYFISTSAQDPFMYFQY